MIIAISGKISSGKDTVGKIGQALIDFPLATNENVLRIINSGTDNSSLQIKKFADTLKDMVCMFIGCTRQQLEDADFKNTELGEEWDCLITTSSYGAKPELSLIGSFEYTHTSKRKMTPRMLLQLLGTEYGRQILHPNIWINALFSKYKGLCNCEKSPSVMLCFNCTGKKYPNWIITDMRFPNELEAVKSRGGITIRVNRTVEDVAYQLAVEKLGTSFTRDMLNAETISDMQQYINQRDNHESETALDNAEFDYVINNSGTLEQLVEEVKLILIKEKIL